MTKKIISILLSVLMIFSAMPIGVFAETSVELSLGTAQIDGADIKIPVTLSALPDGFGNLASLTMEYVYDEDVLTYVGVESAAIELTASQYDDRGISWFDSDSDITSVDDTVVFYLLFTAASEEEAEVEITSAELGTNANGHNYYVPAVNKVTVNSKLAKLSFGSAEIVEKEITVPVVLDIIPGDIASIASFTMEYSYDTSKLEYVDTVSGVLNIAEASSANKGTVSWYATGADVTDVTDALFSLKFAIKDGAEGEAKITIDTLEITDHNNVSKLVETEDKVIALPEYISTPVVSFGPAVINGAKVSIPVTLNKIPDGLSNIASFTMDYTYSTDLLTYVESLDGAMDVEDCATIKDGKISWLTLGEVQPVTDVTAPLFTIVFNVKDGVSGVAVVKPSLKDFEITDSNYKFAENVKLEGTEFTVSGSDVEVVVTGISTNIDELTIPVNTADAEKYIKENLKVYAEYSNGDKKEVTNYTVTINGANIAVAFGNFGADIALSYEKAEVKAGSADVTGTERTFSIPVTMEGIPADIKDIASVTVEYTYDDAVEYAGIEAGIIPVDDASSTDGKVSWFSSTAPVTEVDNSVLFTLKFKAPCDAEAEFDFVIDVEISDSDRKITQSIDAQAGTVKVAAVKHNWGEFVITAPTLDADGSMTRVCANCGETETIAIVMEDISLSKDTLDVPYRFQGEEKLLPYIESQIVAKAIFSDGTEIVIPNAGFTVEGNSVKVAYRDYEKTVALNLEAKPEKEEVYFDVPVVEENREIKVPIVISGIPDGVIDAIESIEIEYTFDDSLLEYADTDNPGDDNLNTNGSETGKAVIGVDVQIETDEVNHTTKAIIIFKAPCDAEGEVNVDITKLVINGMDLSNEFNMGGITINVVPQECVYGAWENHPDTDPKDYKNGMQIRYCLNCGGYETRKLEVNYIEHAQTQISVPYNNHNNKTEAQIAEYLLTTGVLATATLANGEKVNIDNADVTVTVDSTVPKATITYVNAYNEATGEYYDAKCDIALDYKSSTSGSSGGSSRPGNTGGFGGITIIPPVSTSEFKDLPTTHYAYEAVKDLYDRGIISGDGAGNINPNLGITREETAKVALLMNSAQIESGLPIDFDDKDTVSAWAYDYVAMAIKQGVLKGYGDGTVRPRYTVSREEMVAIIIRALNVQINSDVTSKFADVESDRWSAGYIAAASDLGLITGYTDGTFKPEADITRAEAFTIYHRVLKFKDSLLAAIQ